MNEQSTMNETIISQNFFQFTHNDPQSFLLRAIKWQYSIKVRRNETTSPIMRRNNERINLNSSANFIVSKSFPPRIQSILLSWLDREILSRGKFLPWRDKKAIRNPLLRAILKRSRATAARHEISLRGEGTKRTNPPVKTVFINNGLAGIVGSQHVDSRGWNRSPVDNSTRESRQISTGGGGASWSKSDPFSPLASVHPRCNARRTHRGQSTL